jgi:monoamine oxidase
MERRKFVLDTLKIIPLFFIAPNLFASYSKDDDIINPNGKTVLIIGAGISGLAAAKKLKDKGFTVIVLEAQEKTGGRLRTDRSLGIAFDEGASWIHGPNGNPITKLASQAGANTYLTDDDNLEVFDNNGTAYSDAFLDRQYTKFEKALNAVRRAGTKRQSFQTIFNSLYPTQENNRLWKYMLSAYLEFDTGDISKLSSKHFYDDEEFSGKDVIVINGYDKVANFLGQGLDIRLNSRVTEINYNATKSLVNVNENLIEADYVIVSVPLGVLKNNSIAFKPSLPATKVAAIQNIQMGNVNKFLFIWDAPFWDTNIQYIGYTPETKGKFNYLMNMMKFLPTTNGLMTFAYGDYATVTETMTDTQIISEVMAQLKTIYGNSIPNPTNMLRTKWGQNINTFGAYSFATNGTTSADFDTMATEINNKLFFAGEHTERDYRASVHGAYLSGIREADKIIAL